MKLRRPAIAIALGIVAAATAPAQSGDLAAGRTTYEARCINCHEITGEPNDAIARVMGVAMRHLGSPEVQARSDEQLAQVSIEGTERMPATRNLDAAGRANLVAFLRSLALEGNPEP